MLKFFDREFMVLGPRIHPPATHILHLLYSAWPRLWFRRHSDPSFARLPHRQPAASGRGVVDNSGAIFIKYSSLTLSKPCLVLASVFELCKMTFTLTSDYNTKLIGRLYPGLV